MTFSGAMSVIGSHLTTQGSSLSPKIIDVAAGEPAVPPGVCARYWYDGDGDPAHMGGRRTLGDQMIGERVTIRLYWPVQGREAAVSATREASVYAAKAAIKHALVGDSQLGGNCVDLDVGDVSAGWLMLADQGGAWRTLTIPLVLDLVDVDPIGA